MLEVVPEETRARKAGRRAWRRSCFVAATLLVVVATPLSLWQQPAADPLRAPRPLSLGWWAAPFEIHAADRLPWVDADLLDVAAADDGAAVHVVAVGRKGTILVSDGRWHPETARSARSAGVGDAGGPEPAANGALPPPPSPKGPSGGGSLPNRDEKSGKPLPAPGSDKSGAFLLDLLEGQAHAAVAPRPRSNAPYEEEPSVQAQAPEPEPGADAPIATEDLVAIGLGHWPDDVSVLGEAGTWFARRDGQWSARSRRWAAGGTVLSAALGRPQALLLASGELVAPGAPGARLPRLESVRAVRATADGRWLVAVAGARVLCLQGDRWRSLGQPAPVPLRALFFLDPRRGWVVGMAGEVLRTSDGGQHWTSAATIAPVALNAVFFLPDGRRGWVAGNDGYLAASSDGGATFLSRTRPRPLQAGAPATPETPVRLPPPGFLSAWR